MPLKSTFLAFKKKWYKLPKLGGGGGGGGKFGQCPKENIFFSVRASLTWNTVFKAGLWDLYVWWSNWHWTKEILMTLLLMSCSQSNAHFRRLVYTVYWGIWPSILKYKLSGNLVHHDNWSYLWTIGEKANFENISKYVLSDSSGVYVPASSQGWVGAAIIEAIAECSSLFALITPWQLDHKSRRSLRWPV